MAKVEMVGINTMVMPEIIPGSDRGSTVFRNTVNGSAPRSPAASA